MFSDIDLANHQTTFANGNEAQILKLLKRIPVHPPNGDIRAGHFTPKAPTILGEPAPSQNDRGHILFSKQKMVNLADRVGFAKFRTEDSPGEKGALSFEVKYPDELAPTDRGGYLAIWWLPWNGAGALVKEKIEPSTTANLNFGGTMGTVANPNIFFTAAINGCSVFVRGDHDGPSVYHAGLTGDVAQVLGKKNVKRLGKTSEEIWRNLLEGATYSGTNIFPTGGNSKQTNGTFGEVNKSDYISERKRNGDYLTIYDYSSQKKYRSTRQAINFQEWLEDNDDGHAYSISPWGCVVGIRTGNAWKFFLQRNATVVHGAARKEKSGGLFSKKRYVPAGMPQVNVITFGYQQFFPGQGAAHYREFQKVTFY